MTYTISLCALLILAFWAKLVRDHRQHLNSIERCKAAWRKVDLQAVESLFGEDDEFLRSNLSFFAWKKIKLLKVQAELGYLSDLTFNSKLVLRVAQLHLREGLGDPAHHQALADTAMSLRLTLLRAQVRVVLGALIPQLSPAPVPLLRSYASLEPHLAA
jgi:hypothetical protein